MEGALYAVSDDSAAGGDVSTQVRAVHVRHEGAARLEAAEDGKLDAERGNLLQTAGRDLTRRGNYKFFPLVICD